jgi:uncharacterized protein YbjT (DUF2867 family)
MDYVVLIPPAFFNIVIVSRGLSVRINGGQTKVRPVNVSDVATAMHQMLDGNTVGETYELVGYVLCYVTDCRRKVLIP